MSMYLNMHLPFLKAQVESTPRLTFLSSFELHVWLEIHFLISVEASILWIISIDILTGFLVTKGACRHF